MTDHQEHHTEQRGGLKFDPTVNAGHILTFIALMATGFAAWTALDKRVLVLEEQRKTQEVRDMGQDTRINEKFIEIRDAIVEIKRAMEVVRDKVEKRL